MVILPGATEERYQTMLSLNSATPAVSEREAREKMMKTATLKEHPYSSHISRFAVFPSFLSPDDLERGVRAASQSFINPLIPNKAPDVTVVSKTIGGPYRHEILENPTKTRKVAVSWTGENGFLDHPKPVKAKRQIFYPAPPKTVLPNLKLRDWDLSLSERTSNMLRNLERKLWTTSYKMDFTGSGPSNPLKIDDFKEKIITLTRINSHSAPLRERSYPLFAPSKPKGGYGQRQQSRLREHLYSPSFNETQVPAENQSTTTSYINQQPQGPLANYKGAAVMTQMDHSLSESKTGFTNQQHIDFCMEILPKQQSRGKSAADHGRQEDNRKVRFNESLMQECECKSNQAAAVQLSNPQQHFNLSNQLYSHKKEQVKKERYLREQQNGNQPIKKEDFEFRNASCSELHDQLLTKEEIKTRSRELLNSSPYTSILPRPPVHCTNTFERVGRTGSDLSILDLQNSFSKSEAHCRFNSSVTHGAVNLRDNVVTGKRHSFYGINCNHIHG
ncbi:uncharacterized protein C7orf31 homolog [Cyprinodon tularosa]|uniref:uncharacterized protein C7orf31 homolog n=1 Tax=Cyprinodon tularosa TaxID=77115 RepID=UPI0018E27535|nr:uncharacterized protein C7orf31 homolog [Cyprinodon tularosa]